MTILDFKRVWEQIGNSTMINGNGYRVLVELLLNGETTQTELSKRRNWKFSSVSNSMRKLYDMKLVDCKAKNRKLVYFATIDTTEVSPNLKEPIIDMQTFRNLWYIVSDMSQMTSNCFRVYIDICLYGETTQKQLWERRDWKIAGVSSCFNKLYSWGLLECTEVNGNRIYSVKTNLKKEI